jgi:hypothetical protein
MKAEKHKGQSRQYGETDLDATPALPRLESG